MYVYAPRLSKWFTIWLRCTRRNRCGTAIGVSVTEYLQVMKEGEQEEEEQTGGRRTGGRKDGRKRRGEKDGQRIGTRIDKHAVPWFMRQGPFSK